MHTVETKPNGEDTSLAIMQPKDALALGRAPDLVLDEAKKAAVALTQVIEGKAKKVVLNGKTYLQFEDWQTLGRFYGVTAVVQTSKYIEFGAGDDKVKGFESRAEALLVGTNQVISSAEAMCLDDEQNWHKKPLFQLKSMAQTRACAKALRNVLAWVVVLAGYSPTPAEEMTGDEDQRPTFQPPQRKSQAAPSPVPEPTPEVLNGIFLSDEKPVNVSPFQQDNERKAGATCSKCGANIVWHASKTGKKYACNSDNRRDFHNCQ